MKMFRDICINEIYKIVKRKTTLVFFMIIIVSFVLSAVVTLIIKHNNIKAYSDEALLVSINNTLKNIEYEKESLAILSKNNNSDIVQLETLNAQTYWFNYAKEHNILIANGDKSGYYKTEIVDLLIELSTKYNIAIDSYEKENLKLQIDYLTQMLSQDSFETFIDLKISSLEELDEVQKQIYTQYYNLKKEYNIGRVNNHQNAYMNNLANSILQSKLSILNKELSEDEKVEIQEDILLKEYYITNNILVNETNNIVNYNQLYLDICEYSLYILLLFYIVVVASESICSEYEKGTIKQTLLVPIKKWKILIAKILAVVLISFAMLIVVFIIMQLISSIFGSSSSLYYINGIEVHSISQILYYLFRILINYAEILVYMCLTFCIALLIKNSGATVALTVFLAVGNSIFMNMLAKMFEGSSFLKYIPFNNFHLVARVFPNNMNFIDTAINSSWLTKINNTLSFSVNYTIIFCLITLLVILLLWNKKDVLKEVSTS